MSHSADVTYKVVIAGVGGQGAVTTAQLIMGAALNGDYQALQSEVHGMSQRGGAVNAQVLFDKRPVTCPLIMEGTADVLIGLEPLESLRYLHLLKKAAPLVVSNEPIVNMDGYPLEDELLEALAAVPGAVIVDTRTHIKTLKNRQAGNMILLGKASNFLPLTTSMWHEAIRLRFNTKGDEVVQKNIEAFMFGKNL